MLSADLHYFFFTAFKRVFFYHITTFFGSNFQMWFKMPSTSLFLRSYKCIEMETNAIKIHQNNLTKTLVKDILVQLFTLSSKYVLTAFSPICLQNTCVQLLSQQINLTHAKPNSGTFLTTGSSGLRKWQLHSHTPYFIHSQTLCSVVNFHNIYKISLITSTTTAPVLATII